MALRYSLSATFALLLALSVQAQGTQSGSGQGQSGNQGQSGKQGQAGQGQTGNQNQGQGGRMFPQSIYQMRDVSGALKLTPEQTNRLSQFDQKMQGRYRTQFEKFGTAGQGGQNDQFRELQQKYGSEWMTGARDIFNDQQWQRYQQLNRQYMGFDAFSDPQLRKDLNLTDKQLEQIQQASQWSREQQEAINKLGQKESAQGLRQYSTYQKEMQDRLNRILTDDQQRSWRTMIGDPFNFQPTFGNQQSGSGSGSGSGTQSNTNPPSR